MAFELEVHETIRYEETLIVEEPAGMTKEEAKEIINKVEQECKEDSSTGDIAFHLQHTYGFTIKKFDKQFPDASSQNELEIVNVKELKEV